MQIINGVFENNGIGAKSKGGTEYIANKIVEKTDPELLKEFQIVVSRVEEPLDESKIRIYFPHDLPHDPACDHLKNGGWNKFHKIVFVSNWQMQQFIAAYKIPWSHCIVIQNAIEPIDLEKWESPEKIKLIYTSTPHRGLNILVSVFDKLCERYNNLELDVFSSFKIYGWEERDNDFKELFDQCEAHPKINYHGVKSNDEVRTALQKAHIFAYPSIWPETSCLSLLEAMSAGCICVHSNYAALYETSANLTYMYHFNENLQDHAKIFFTILCLAIEDIKNDDKNILKRLGTQKSYVDLFYNWNDRSKQWNALFNMLLSSIKDRSIAKEMFVYNV